MPAASFIRSSSAWMANVSPFHGTDDRILFTSDRTRGGDRLTYPRLDEYEATPTVSGIWLMAPDGSDLRLLDHSPSGAFTPIVASDGRIIRSSPKSWEAKRASSGCAPSLRLATWRSWSAAT
jgi:hypothetical protein